MRTPAHGSASSSTASKWSARRDRTGHVAYLAGRDGDRVDPVASAYAGSATGERGRHFVDLERSGSQLREHLMAGRRDISGLEGRLVLQTGQVEVVYRPVLTGPWRVDPPDVDRSARRKLEVDRASVAGNGRRARQRGRSTGEDIAGPGAGWRRPLR